MEQRFVIISGKITEELNQYAKKYKIGRVIPYRKDEYYSGSNTVITSYLVELIKNDNENNFQ